MRVNFGRVYNEGGDPEYLMERMRGTSRGVKMPSIRPAKLVLAEILELQVIASSRSIDHCVLLTLIGHITYLGLRRSPSCRVFSIHDTDVYLEHPFRV